MTGNGSNDRFTCGESERTIVEYADGRVSGPERERFEGHLATCAGCRAALDDQRAVVEALGRRQPIEPTSGFAARVSARLDRETPEGLLDLVNWRAWTVGLAPVAAALLLAAYIGVGATVVTEGEQTTTSTYETWASAGPAAGTAAAVLLEPSATGETLVESVLIGGVPAASGEHDVR